MVEVTVTKRWLNAVQGEMSHEQHQRWSDAENVFCPACGVRAVWVEETGHYDEDNAGGCYLCAQCGHSFHYSSPDNNYISGSEAALILAAVRSI
jgi:hypothetical protein